MPTPFIPKPPRFLLLSLGLLTAFCFLAGFVLDKKGTAVTPKFSRDLDISIKENAGVELMKKELEEKGYRVTLHPEYQAQSKTSGFIVAEFMEPAVASSTSKALSTVYHFPVTLKQLNPDQTQIQIGSIYKSEQEANQLKDKLEVLGYHWHVRPNVVTRHIGTMHLHVSHIPMDQVSQVINECNNKNLPYHYF